ncbi:retinoblastoma-like protein 1 [Anticarsia gemmatalis]|uniref:retinoblastoma-like protein 1 n=1 Tax=Anticarsia gemmatalis TaxID=129554 RepID=UPI003F761842
MSKLEDSDNNWIAQMDTLCSNLNVDSVAAHKAKELFADIKKNCTLDGDILHWMACALYVACRTSITPTVQSGTAVEGNCVSLTRLLRLCNISLIEFFKKIKRWMDMASMSTEFKDRISHLEHKFAVSTVLFRKFQPIFQEIFLGLTNETPKPNSKRRQKLQPCTTNALFEFNWALYICVKGEFHKSAHDLVDMYHLLLASLDFVFANAFMARRIDLLNPAFKGLPSDWLKDDFKMPETAPCIISTLCELKDGLLVDASASKEYCWKPVIKNFFEKAILKGNGDQLNGVLDVGYFDANLKALNNVYETYVLSVGEFDERIFLGEYANEQIGTKNKVSADDEISQVIATFGPSNRACHETPLTGRRYLARRAEELTPVSEAKNSLTRLANYLRQAKPQPSRDLFKLFSDCNVSAETINANLIKPCETWMEQFANSLRETNMTSSNETIAFRCNMVTCLYYKVVEHIIREEHRKKPQVSLEILLSQETYQLTVYACCTEIVLHAYGVHSLKFPRVLQIYGLSAFHFYKIIELVVQAVVEKLSRDVIKHLNAVEEEVLESLVWTSDSPLWDQLSRTPVPASIDVKVHESPNRRNNGLQSPISAVKDVRYLKSPDNAKKQLFKDPIKSIKPGQSLLVATNTVHVKQEPNTLQPPQNPPQNGDSSTTPKKTNNSLILFFRKFYSLAVVRINDLCSRLCLTDEELKRKIWTCLEYSIMHQTQLMKDRHLDQILMCAVYVTCRVSNKSTNQVEKTFADIMKCYRQRPLADNHVYRSVLIKQSEGDSSPERGDLINFYNKVYVQCIQSFVLRFTGKHKDECSLSPLPASRGDAAWSPAGQRVSERHQLYVKPLTTPPPANLHLTYRFSRSPAKDLHAINTLVSCEVGGHKRGALVAGAELGADVVKRSRYGAPGVARKLHGLITDRQAQDRHRAD